MKMKKSAVNICFLLFVGVILALSVWGPETLARYKDRAVLNEVHTEEEQDEGEGYRYSLNNNEKLHLLSKCLNSQIQPEYEQNALSGAGGEAPGYSEPGSYAFVVNYRDSSNKEITDQEIFATCNQSLERLKELGILPETLSEMGTEDYDAVLYSAIDVLEPRNNVSVWKVSLKNSQKNANKENKVIDLCLDADTGKIYEFYARTGKSWEEIDPDSIMKSWSEYLGLGIPVPYETENPLLETTPFFKKYLVDGAGGEQTTVTVGYYEGIRELYLKISK